jgi:uncharacterized protein (TIGR02265 family)
MPPSPAAAPAESLTEVSVFEGLFIRAVQPTGAFLAALQAAGYDPARPELRYPTRVWHACVEVARRHLYPQLPEAEGFRTLGHVFMEGYYQTLIGKVVGAAMPLLGPERSIQRIPRTWKASQPGLGVHVEKKGERHYLIRLEEQGMLADFCAGLLESAANPLSAKIRVDVVERGPAHCVLSARW